MEQDDAGRGGRPDAARPLRADARRSRDALLDAAATVFARSGVDAPIKVIADAAGVGVGTFYRRFPKRSDLIVAVLRHEVDDCAEAAQALAGAHAPFTALSRWIQRYVAFVAAKRGLAAAMRSDEPAYQDLPDYLARRLVPVLSGLLAAAASEVRSDVTAADLLRTVPLLCSPDEDGGFDQARRMVALLVDGLSVTRRSDE